MTINETANIQSLSSAKSNTGKKSSAFNSEDYKLKTTSIFTKNDEAKTNSKNAVKENDTESQDSLLASFKDFLKWNLTGGILGNLVRGEIGDIIDTFKKETGLTNADLALSAASPMYGAFKIAANSFKDDAKNICESENDDAFGEIAANLDFES